MPLAPESKLEIDRLQREKGWGGRRIGKALGLPYGQVRRHLESRDTGGWPVPTFTVLVWDLETASLYSDIGYIMVGSFLNLGTGEMRTERMVSVQEDSAVAFADAERDVVERVSALYESADILVGHNSHAFDKNYLNGVRTRLGLPALPKRHQIDTMQIAQHGVKGRLQSTSLANLCDIFGIAAKDHPPKAAWRESHARDRWALERLVERCESDVRLTAELFDRLRPYWQGWRGA